MASDTVQSLRIVVKRLRARIEEGKDALMRQQELRQNVEAELRKFRKVQMLGIRSHPKFHPDEQGISKKELRRLAE